MVFLRANLRKSQCLEGITTVTGDAVSGEGKAQEPQCLEGITTTTINPVKTDPLTDPARRLSLIPRILL